MYEAIFGLQKRPFAPAPRVECYFPAAAIESARQTLIRCVQRGEGAAVVVGPSGTGKTLLCQVVAEHFRGGFDVVLLSSGRLGNRKALLQGILHGLGKPYRGMDEEELRLSLLDCLEALDAGGAVLLVVDEAHTLALRCLDELRTITNIAVDGQPRVRLVLAGAPLLEERLATPQLDSFSQRLAARCYLEAFNQRDTEGYIQVQMAMAGGATSVFGPEALHAVYQATGGVPRLINQVCDHALLLACAAGRRQVDATLIQEAWADLQQLPSPWNGEKSKDSMPTETIEFGSLDEEPGQQLGDVADECDANGQEIAPTSDDVSPTDAEAATPEPVQQIGEIEQMLGELDEDFQPAGTIGPEVELVLDDPTSPFTEPFEEEKVVVDRYAAALAQRNAQASEVIAATCSGAVRGAGGIIAETVPLRRKASFAELDPEEPEIVVEDQYDFAEQPPAHPVTPVRRHEYRQLFARLRRG